MSELPQGWAESSLLELTGIGGLMTDGDWIESKDQDPNGEVRLIQLSDIGDKEFLDKSNRFLTLVKAEELRCTFLKEADILIARMPDPLGRACVFPSINKPSVTAVDICIWRSGEHSAYAKWLMYIINSPDVRNKIQSLASGTTRQRISGGNLKKLSLPVPPLNEQCRIVTKLDRLFARSRRAREELERIPKLIDRYKQAILAAAFRGDLTADWREENPPCEKAKDLLIRFQRQQGIIREFIPDADSYRDRFYADLPNDWCWAKVEDIGEVFLGRQRSPKNHNGSNMRSYVRAANITWNGWNLSDIKEMNFDERDFRKYKLRTGDVLINEGSGSADEVGKPAIWNNEIENCCFQNTLICVRPFESMSQYLYLVFLHAARSKTFVEETRGVNIFHIGKERLSQFKIALPPLVEQQEIIQRVEKLFKAIDLMAQEYQKASQLLDRLDQATLAKAFRGELVPQDPNDEPAAALLDRLLAENPTQTKGKGVKSKQRSGGQP